MSQFVVVYSRLNYTFILMSLSDWFNALVLISHKLITL